MHPIRYSPSCRHPLKWNKNKHKWETTLCNPWFIGPELSVRLTAWRIGGLEGEHLNPKTILWLLMNRWLLVRLLEECMIGVHTHLNLNPKPIQWSVLGLCRMACELRTLDLKPNHHKPNTKYQRKDNVLKSLQMSSTFRHQLSLHSDRAPGSSQTLNLARPTLTNAGILVTPTPIAAENQMEKNTQNQVKTGRHMAFYGSLCCNERAWVTETYNQDS